MTLKAQTTVKCFLKTLSSVCESVIFMYLGISAVVSTHQLDLMFIIGTLAGCLVSRVIGKYLLFISLEIYSWQCVQKLVSAVCKKLKSMIVNNFRCYQLKL